MKKPRTKAEKTGHKPSGPAVKKAQNASAVTSRTAAGPLKAAPPEPFTKKELSEIQARLSEMRDDITKAVDDKKTLDMTEPEVGDSIDQAAQSLDKEILFELSDNERSMLDNIEAALRKIDNGTYGVCEHCKKPIEKKRLKALPAARYCMLCQSGAEKSRIH